MAKYSPVPSRNDGRAHRVRAPWGDGHIQLKGMAFGVSEAPVGRLTRRHL